MPGHIVGTLEWENEVIGHVADHEHRERDLLETYRGLAADEDMSPAFRYLAGMILEDEERHHRTFAALAATMRDGDDPDRPDLVPSLRGLRADRYRVTRVTDQLLELERDDLRELKRLSKQLKELGSTTMWVLLIELMIADTRKHIEILRFVRKRASDQPD